MKSNYTIPIAIVLGGIILAIAVYVSGTGSLSLPGNLADSGNPTLVRPVGINDHILGNPAAKVMIVEYSDFDCEYCKGFDDTLRQIIASEGADGDIAWVYRQFPLTEIHPNAMKHAEATECVADVAGNEAFWKFSAILFASQPIDPSQYGTYAKKAGVSGDAFASCFAAAATRVDARIKADRKNALDIGAQGTPYSLILVAGKPPVVISGAHPYEEVRLLVEEALTGVQ
jgi:protein-disulfide isomerase